MRRLALAFLALLITAACAQDLASSTHQVVLGAIYPLSGPQAPGGKSELAGVQAALRHSRADVLLPRYKLAKPRAVIVQVDDIYGRSVGGGEEQLAQVMGIDVVDVIEYNPNAYDPDVIAARLAQDRTDFLWDVSYLDDGVAIWKAVLNHHITLKGAIGTSSAFCMPAFSERLGPASIGVYAADKPDGDVGSAALSGSGRGLLARATAAYSGGSMDIPAVAGFVGGWTLLHDVLPKVDGSVNAETIRLAALGVDVPVGDSVNGGGVKFAGVGALDEGQNTRAAAVVGQWQAVGVMKIVYPPAYTG